MPTRNCPTCGHVMKLDTAASIYRCAACGQTIERAYESLDEATARIRAKGPRPSHPLTHRGAVDPRARAIYETAHDYLWREDTAEAIRHFRRALDVQPDFADAHLWIAKLSDDEAVQREHLGEILAHDLGHTEALRLLMVLNGRLTPDQAERTRSDHQPEIRQAEGPVKARPEVLLCPVCGGHLTIDDQPAGKRVVCRFCGHQAASAAPAAAGADLLGMALLERRAQPVRWHIGQRMLHCTQCGADRTIPAGQLSGLCPFCGSNQVITQDALQTIEQPNGLVPFVLSEQNARAAIREQLKTFNERLYRLLDNNRIVHKLVEGVYLPFWVFDALLEVSVTTFDKRVSLYDRRALQLGHTGHQHYKTSAGVSGLLVPGVTNPPARLLEALGDYDLSAAIPYQPRLLAKHPAALYDIDFVQASLEARSKAAAKARADESRHKDANLEVHVTALVIQMTFSLMLLPVWMATLVERDGDVRQALVNGQTGKVALGAARRSPHDARGRRLRRV
jgi:predicted RNA-binding Zn-ribbon protein involved in translation (DUF1610 family)